MFGAYVDPSKYTEAGRIAAFKGFDTTMGGGLQIYHTFHKWTVEFPSVADQYFGEHDKTVFISWAGTDTERIINGSEDRVIEARAIALKRAGFPIMLEWRWEMNRPNLRHEIHSPDRYVSAWKHIHRIFARLNVNNVSWVWCPLASDTADPDFSSYYPGDAYVDWVCADGYAIKASQTWNDVFDPFLQWARDVNKPILIGEFGRRKELGNSNSLADWFADARAEVKRTPQIKAICYFNNPHGSSGSSTDIRGFGAAEKSFRRWATDPYFFRVRPSN